MAAPILYKTAPTHQNERSNIHSRACNVLEPHMALRVDALAVYEIPHDAVAGVSESVANPVVPSAGDALRGACVRDAEELVHLVLDHDREALVEHRAACAVVYTSAGKSTHDAQGMHKLSDTKGVYICKCNPIKISSFKKCDPLFDY